VESKVILRLFDQSYQNGLLTEYSFDLRDKVLFPKS